MESLKAHIYSLGYSGSVSVLGQFFGFANSRMPTDPTGAHAEVSVQRQISRLKGDYFNLNIIRVGRENFTAANIQEIDYTIYRFRNIYNQVNIGIGRVQHWGVNAADAGGLDSPTTLDDLEEISNRWYAPNDGIDLFVPSNMNVPGDTPGSVILGLSPVPGPCASKDSKGMNGSVCGLWGDEQTSRSSTHEVGHYLGLGHQNGSPDNLMCQSGSASNIRTSVVLWSTQGYIASVHCMMH